MRPKLSAAVFLLLLLATAALSQSASPEETVKTFYKFSDAHSSTFNRRHIEARRKWYTSALYRAFNAQLKKDNAHLKANPTDKPFFGEGLNFKPLDEPCEARGKSYPPQYTIGRSSIQKSIAYVDVRFTYPKACRINSIRYRVSLRKMNRQWLIADWIYSDGDTLTQEMKEQRY